MKLRNEYKKNTLLIFNMENIKCSIIEIKKDKRTSRVEDIMKCIEESEKKIIQDDGENFSTVYFLMEEEYNQFTKKELERICDYYGINKRKKRKNDLIQDIIIFEQDIQNSELVDKRIELWYCIEQIKNDNYLKKFLILE
tara:strand:- start:1823 stop:2242 length:420 start_codon:yes stop_codon:yes gene_type:complete